MTEFELIRRYFTGRQQTAASSIPLGIGDDCALMSARSGNLLAISSDMLVEGRHFFPNADPTWLGHKSLAVNLSDLAAMGAEPRAFTLALALPEANSDWLRDFSKGVFELADKHHCQLIGGDTTKGPLTICITVFGDIPDGQALRRDAAKVGDDIWVSGTLGDARLALAGYWGEQTLSETDQHQAALRMHQPTPRIELGMALRQIAHAAIDISDGLTGDLGHILDASQVGATLWCDALPAGQILSQQPVSLRRAYTLSGGDDYELCFTAPANKRSDVMAAAKKAATDVTRVGVIESQQGLRLVDVGNQPVIMSVRSFDHFS